MQRALTFLLFVSSLQAGTAAADVYRVGTDDDYCHTASLQDAIDAARVHPGFDIIHVARNAEVSALALTIDSGDGLEVLEIAGGYDTCRDSYEQRAPHGHTTLDGAGGSRASVVTIVDDAYVDVELKQLWITRGDATNDGGRGGGVRFSGAGYLQLSQTMVSGNAAERGGGVFAHARNGDVLLQLNAGSQIVGNRAERDGGGIYLDGSGRFRATLTATAPDTSIRENSAPGGRGGGIFIHGYTDTKLGSPGTGNAHDALIAFNRAQRGAGIAMKSDSDRNEHAALLNAESSAAGHVVHFHGNVATGDGGAIHIETDSATPQFADGWMRIRDYLFTDNVAADGAVAFIDGSGAATGALALVSGNCRAYPCLRVERNQTTGGGSLVRVRIGNTFRSDRGVFAWNLATHLLRVDGPHHPEASPGALLSNLAIVQNEFSGSMFHLHSDDGRVSLRDSTVADNIAPAIFHGVSADDRVVVRNSILSETGPLLQPGSGAALETEYNIVSDAGILAGGDVTSVVAPANFLDRSVGDYRLKPGSRAVDHAPRGGDAEDLLFGPRERDFALKPDAGTPRDVGALEYDAGSDELVMNNEFAGDLRAWAAMPNSAATIARHADGLPGAIGALQAVLPVDAGAGDHAVATHCIPLPRGGWYRLRGFAEAGDGEGARRDVAGVRVIVRAAASDCDPAAPIVATRDAWFPVQAGWTALAPVDFNIAVPVEPTWNASLELQLLVKRAPGRVGVAPSAVRFDRPSLLPAAAATAIFADSFD